jgi:hypothetical protein
MTIGPAMDSRHFRNMSTTYRLERKSMRGRRFTFIRLIYSGMPITSQGGMVLSGFRGRAAGPRTTCAHRTVRSSLHRSFDKLPRHA